MSEVNVPAAAMVWVTSDDVGASSMTLWSALAGAPMRHGRRPQDASDFGRCYRLLERVPEWRPRLAEVVEEYPDWGPLVAVWDELEILWLACGIRDPWDDPRDRVAVQRLTGALRSLERACNLAGTLTHRKATA